MEVHDPSVYTNTYINIQLAGTLIIYRVKMRFVLTLFTYPNMALRTTGKFA
jgi:hypothetical protein